MKIALSQINPVVGDVAGNTAKILDRLRDPMTANVDVVVFPELAITGYPPNDLLLKRRFVDSNVAALEDIARHTDGRVVIVGYVRPNSASRGKGLLNMAAVCSRGRILHSYAKILLPTYDVFDESRYFQPGRQPGLVEIPIAGKLTKVGLSICEDLWSDDEYFARRLYDGDPIADLATAGADLIVNIGASPFSLGKPQRRLKLFGNKAAAHEIPLVYVNQVGGNDDLIFDGASGAFDATGRLIAHAHSFREDVLVVDLDVRDGRIEPLPENMEAVYAALVLGTRDYVQKCGFTDVVIGVSGGIDSAVTAAIAVDAIGPQRVHLIAMPSRYSSTHSLEDALALAESLHAEFLNVPLDSIHQALELVLAPLFENRPMDVTEENMQARIRGTLLMALSNKFGWLLLTTGNKSELAVGYCTLYGDMCGGLAVINDVPKTMVYQLARYMNQMAGADRIPQRTITKAPSAELKPHQTDQDSLPPYDTLDAILEAYIEREQMASEIVAAGLDQRTVREVIRMVDGNEYKRKQAPVGLKVTSRAFGSGRRMPIAARY